MGTKCWNEIDDMENARGMGEAEKETRLRRQSRGRPWQYNGPNGTKSSCKLRFDLGNDLAYLL
jgi:hypothetical protein